MSANRLFRGWVAVGSICGVLGCAESPAPKTAAPPATENPAVSEEPATEPATATSAPVTSSPDAGAAEAVPETNEAPADAGNSATQAAADKIASLCENVCKRADQHCSKRSARVCRANCDRYTNLAQTCSTEVQATLECVAKAPPGLICSNVAPSACEGQFRAMHACEQGKKLEQPSAEQNTAPPEGWEQLKDTKAGFSVFMPEGAEQSQEPQGKLWKSEQDGIIYLSGAVPHPDGKPSSRKLLVVTTKFVGYTCQKGLKIHGHYEDQGLMAARFDSKCKDGTEWHGMLRFSDDTMYVTAFKAPAGKSGIIDDFVYSFKKH